VLISTGLILNFNWRGHGGKFQKIKMPCLEADARARHPISISMVISLLGGTVIVTSTHFPQKWPFAWLDRYGVSFDQAEVLSRHSKILRRRSSSLRERMPMNQKSSVRNAASLLGNTEQTQYEFIFSPPPSAGLPKNPAGLPFD
jgi:hypothetical protein